MHLPSFFQNAFLTYHVKTNIVASYDWLYQTEITIYLT